MTDLGKSNRIGFLIKTYPKLSETFVLGEILGLEARGLPLCIYSLQQPTDVHVHTATASVQAGVTYLTGAGLLRGMKVLLAHLKTLNRAPGRYLKTVGRALRAFHPGIFREFSKAVCLNEHLRRDGVVHLHAHFACQPASVAEFVWRLSGMPYSISAHAKDIYLSDPSELARKLDHASFTVTCTGHNYKYLKNITPNGARIFRMYHGIDTALFQADSTPAGNTGDPPLLLSVGRLRPKKGLTTLVHACEILMSRGIDFRCEIIGYGPEKETLERHIAEAGLCSHVKLLGKLTHSEVIEAYRRAAAFVLPCQVTADGDRDGIPNVLLEAMAMHLPVVSTTVSGIPEAVSHGINGLLVPPGDLEATAGALMMLLQDPKLCDRLGRAGRATVIRDFSDRNLELLVSLLSSVREHGVEPVMGDRGGIHSALN